MYAQNDADAHDVVSQRHNDLYAIGVQPTSVGLCDRWGTALVTHFGRQSACSAVMHSPIQCRRV